MKVSDVGNLANVRRIIQYIDILHGLLDRTSTATASESVSSGTGKLLLGILKSVAIMTPPTWDDRSLQ